MLLGGFEKEIIKLTDLHARMQLKRELASRAKEVKDFLDSCEALVSTVRAYIAAAEKMSVTKDKIKKNSALL